MTPLLSFRMWLRRAAPVEKKATATAVAIVLALLAWALVPTDRGGSRDVSVVGGAADTGTEGVVGASGAGQTTPTTAGITTGTATAPSNPAVQGGTATPARGAGSSTASGPAASAGADRCGASGATDQGVTASTILVAFAYLDLAGLAGEKAFHFRSDLPQISDAVVDDINKTGGIKCRKVVVKYYKANPLDSNGLHATCLQIVQDKPIAVFDNGGFTLQRTCMAQYHIPVIAETTLFRSEVTTYFPYMFSLMPTARQVMRNYVFGMKDAGFFDPAQGFSKLGVLRESCFEDDGYQTLSELLQQIGISGDKLTTYDLTCGAGDGAPGPDAVAQAVLQMKTAGATNLFPTIDNITLDNFTQVAQQQQYHPRYAASDFSSQIGQEGNVNPDQFDGTVGITSSRWGESPPFNTDPASRRCNKIMADHGVRGMETIPDQTVGGTCDQWWMFRAAAENAPQLIRTQLVNGLAKAKSIEMAYPWDNALFTRPGQVTGGTSVRIVVWHKDCTCWRLPNPDFRPEY